MKRILFVMLEIDSASGTCVMNDAVQLLENGWDVHILSYETKRKAPEGVRFEFVPRKLFQELENRTENPRWKKLFAGLYRLQVAFFSCLWPLNSLTYPGKLERAIRKQIDRNRYDVVVPVYTQLDPLIAVFRIKKRNPALKCVAYFIDSLSAGPTPRLLSEEGKIKKGLRWEARLCSAMDGVIFMESSRRHHERYSRLQPYYSKCVFLDIPALVMRHDGGGNDAPVKKDRFVAAYAGSMPLRIRDPEYAFRVLSRMKDIPLDIVFVGPEADEMKSVDTHGLDVRWVGRVPHEEVEKYMREADVLINIGNNVPGMVPSKVFEYIAVKKPILSFAPTDDEPSIPYLEKYGSACSVVGTDDFEENVQAVRAFLTDLPRERLSDADLERRFYNNLPRAFAEYIESAAREERD